MDSNNLMETLSRAKAVMNLTENKNYKPSATNLEELKHKLSNNTNNFLKKPKPNGLPTEIYESIVNNPLTPNSSILDNFDSSNIIKASQIQNENGIQQPTLKQIDLTEEKLEFLIEKVLNKVLSKKLLTEEQNNKLNTVRLTENKLQFLTSNGDLYVAELKFIKNIKK